MLTSKIISLGDLGSESYWIARLVSASTEYGNGVVTDEDKNVYVLGNTTTSTLFAAKYSSSGSLLWQKTYSYLTTANVSTNLISASATSLAIGARTSSTNASVILINKSDGEITLQKSVPNMYADATSAAVAADSSGNIYIGCFYYASSYVRPVIVKFNSSLTIQWARPKTDLGSGYYIYGCYVGPSSDIYFCGWSTLSAGSTVQAYNSSGSTSYAGRRLLGNGRSYGVVVDSSGNVYVACGLVSGYGYIVKYNSAGVLQWQRKMQTSTYLSFFGSIALDSSGNVYACGYTRTTASAGSELGLVVKYSPDGTLQWQRTLGTSPASSVSFNKITLDSSNNICLSGSVATDAITVKVPSDGSKTGTYGSYVYSASTLTESASTFSEGNFSLSPSSPTYTPTTPTLASASGSFTSTTTTL